MPHHSKYPPSTMRNQQNR